MNEWVYCMAVILRRGERGDLHGLQFFNKRGETVHKIYATPRSQLEGWAAIVDKYTTHQEPIVLTERERPAPPAEKPDAEIDVAGFQQAWRSLTDTHQFFGMLKSYGVSRPQALRLAPEGMVSTVNRLAVERMLQLAAERGVPIMCFVHSPGCIQIHTGPVKRIKQMGRWLSVLDPKFNLHLDTEAIDRAYVVRKPTSDGIVTSLELYTAAGELITYFFGARKPGKPELSGWTEIAESLVPVSA
jgi:putative hemin transport protein